MKFGVRLANSGPFASRHALTEMAVAAEALGYDAVSIHDHVTWGLEDRYHFYAGSHETAAAMDRPFEFLSAFSTMAYLSAITSRIRIVSTALCLAWRHPLLVAREASTLHELSEGRVVLGVCPGNVRHDFEVTGTDWEERGKLTEESVQILRLAIDTDGPISYQGRHFSFTDAEIYPRPAGMKLWYGGTSKAAVRRAAQYCDGWIPGGGPDYFRENLPRIGALAHEAGRPVDDFEVAMISRLHIADSHDSAMRVAGRTLQYQDEAEWLKRHDLTDMKRTWLIGSAEAIRENIDAAADAGVTMIFHTIIAHTLQDVIGQMKAFADSLMPAHQTQAASVL